MIQVNWDEAPEWANFHAFDEDGTGYWYEYHPQMQVGMWNTKGKSCLSIYQINWTQTLTRRPAAQNKAQ